MVISLHPRGHGQRHKRDVDAEKHLKRLHQTTPLIQSPLAGADHDKLVFSQRHEANSVELFFDLFFAANLATFTTYHSITDSNYLLGYIGFFGIVWSCWFQVTMHDVRFARDSMYERVCKTTQFIVFAGLALVGSDFNPGAAKGNNVNFRILCYTLVISRALLVIQYLVVLFYTYRARYSKLYLPLGLMVLLYAVAAVGFVAMIPSFAGQKRAHHGVYMVWYVIMIVEAIAAIAISSVWKMLSFKKTHLMERMSLLTLIVIGEGAIGVTKTVSLLMGKNGLEFEGCFLIMCCIVLLIFLWALYFDNFPHGHYGTIRQQIWSLLHFPLQLAIVGLVEGARQVTLARYVLRNYVYIESTIESYCLKDNLDGVSLRDKLMALLQYWQFEKKIETYTLPGLAADHIYTVGNATNICSPANGTYYMREDAWPNEFANMTKIMFDGIYRGLGMDLPVYKLERQMASQIGIESFKIVYIYFWTSFCIVIACSIAFLFLIRRHRPDLFDFVSVISRIVTLGIGAALAALAASDTALYNFLGSWGVLPCCLFLLFLVLCLDKISAVFCNWQVRKSGQPYAKEHEDHHHVEFHVHDVDEGTPGLDVSEHNRKSAAWSMHSDTEPLTLREGEDWSVREENERGADTTSYQPEESYALRPMMSPPMLSPPLGSPSPPPGQIAGGYAPLTHSGA